MPGRRLRFRIDSVMTGMQLQPLPSSEADDRIS
jgi:hypothetical protein